MRLSARRLVVVSSALTACPPHLNGAGSNAGLTFVAQLGVMT